MHEKLNETKSFIQNTISSRKPIFNQAEPIYMDSKSSLIGQLAFNDDALDMTDHKLKIQFLNDLVNVTVCELEPELIRQTSYLVPMIHQRVLNVSKTSYDEYSNISLTISDLNGKQLAKNYDSFQSRINAVGSHANHVLVALTDKNTGRDLVKLYNSSLQLITTIVIEFQCEAFLMNDSFVYLKLSGNYPYVLKFDYDLVRQPLFESFNKSSELFVALVVDKLVYFSSQSNRVYFNDKCFSRLKIYSELSGDLLHSLHINNLRDCSIRIDSSLNNSLNDQFICLNRSEHFIRCYDLEDYENGGVNLVAENFLSDKIKNISNFYLTKDGYYVFVDHLNDAIYFYWDDLHIEINMTFIVNCFYKLVFFIKTLN